MIDAPHGFTLTKNEAPRADRRRKATLPTLTVERGPRDAGRSGVTLDPLPVTTDLETWGEGIAEKRAAFISRCREQADERIADVVRQRNDAFVRIAHSYKYRQKAGREALIARECESWRRTADEAIAGLEHAFVQRTTASVVLCEDAHEPGLYTTVTEGMGLSIDMIEPCGVTVTVMVTGDVALQARVLTLLDDLAEARVPCRAR